MAQFASDSFTGTDGATLQTHSANWVKHSSSAVDLIITGDRVRCAGTGTSTYYHTTAPASADYSVSADLYVVALEPGYNYTGVGGRVDPSAVTYYQLRYAYGIGWTMMKVVAGVGTTLGSAVPEELPAGSTRRIKLDMVGSTITALVDDVETVVATDSSITSAGRAGLRVFNNSTTTTSDGLRLDNFNADEAGAAAHNLTVSLATQSNTASPAAISQTHTLSVQTSAQAASVSTAAIEQAHALGAAPSTQANASASGAITQSHALTADGATQANTANTGAISQGAQFAADPGTQANTGGTGAITQVHALAGAAGTQGNTAAVAAITQVHALAVAGSTQANAGSSAAISQGVVHDFAASASSQTNTSATGAITQAHVLVCPASVQDSIAAASAIVQAHILIAEHAAQANAASSGAIEQSSGIPPVDGPAGSGPRLRISHGHRPAMRNTSRPRQLR